MNRSNSSESFANVDEGVITRPRARPQVREGTSSHELDARGVREKDSLGTTSSSKLAMKLLTSKERRILQQREALAERSKRRMETEHAAAAAAANNSHSFEPLRPRQLLNTSGTGPILRGFIQEHGLTLTTKAGTKPTTGSQPSLPLGSAFPTTPTASASMFGPESILSQWDSGTRQARLAILTYLSSSVPEDLPAHILDLTRSAYAAAPSSALFTLSPPSTDAGFSPVTAAAAATVAATAVTPGTSANLGEPCSPTTTSTTTTTTTTITSSSSSSSTSSSLVSPSSLSRLELPFVSSPSSSHPHVDALGPDVGPMMLSRITAFFRLTAGSGGHHPILQLRTIFAFVDAALGPLFAEAFFESGGAHNLLSVVASDAMPEPARCTALSLLVYFAAPPYCSRLGTMAQMLPMPFFVSQVNAGRKNPYSIFSRLAERVASSFADSPSSSSSLSSSPSTMTATSINNSNNNAQMSGGRRGSESVAAAMRLALDPGQGFTSSSSAATPSTTITAEVRRAESAIILAYQRRIFDAAGVGVTIRALYDAKNLPTFQIAHRLFLLLGDVASHLPPEVLAADPAAAATARTQQRNAAAGGGGGGGGAEASTETPLTIRLTIKNYLENLYEELVSTIREQSLPLQSRLVAAQVLVTLLQGLADRCNLPSFPSIAHSSASTNASKPDHSLPTSPSSSSSSSSRPQPSPRHGNHLNNHRGSISARGPASPTEAAQVVDQLVLAATSSNDSTRTPSPGPFENAFSSLSAAQTTTSTLSLHKSPPPSLRVAQPLPGAAGGAVADQGRVSISVSPSPSPSPSASQHGSDSTPRSSTTSSSLSMSSGRSANPFALIVPWPRPSYIDAVVALFDIPSVRARSLAVDILLVLAHRFQLLDHVAEALLSALAARLVRARLPIAPVLPDYPPPPPPLSIELASGLPLLRPMPLSLYATQYSHPRVGGSNVDAPDSSRRRGSLTKRRGSVTSPFIDLHLSLISDPAAAAAAASIAAQSFLPDRELPVLAAVGLQTICVYTLARATVIQALDALVLHVHGAVEMLVRGGITGLLVDSIRLKSRKVLQVLAARTLLHVVSRSPSAAAEAAEAMGPELYTVLVEAPDTLPNAIENIRMSLLFSRSSGGNGGSLSPSSLSSSSSASSLSSPHVDQRHGGAGSTSSSSGAGARDVNLLILSMAPSAQRRSRGLLSEMQDGADTSLWGPEVSSGEGPGAGAGASGPNASGKPNRPGPHHSRASSTELIVSSGVQNVAASTSAIGLTSIPRSVTLMDPTGIAQVSADDIERLMNPKGVKDSSASRPISRTDSRAGAQSTQSSSTSSSSSSSSTSSSEQQHSSDPKANKVARARQQDKLARSIMAPEKDLFVPLYLAAARTQTEPSTAYGRRGHVGPAAAARLQGPGTIGSGGVDSVESMLAMIAGGNAHHPSAATVHDDVTRKQSGATSTSTSTSTSSGRTAPTSETLMETMTGGPGGVEVPTSKDSAVGIGGWGRIRGETHMPGDLGVADPVADAYLELHYSDLLKLHHKNPVWAPSMSAQARNRRGGSLSGAGGGAAGAPGAAGGSAGGTGRKGSVAGRQVNTGASSSPGRAVDQDSIDSVVALLSSQSSGGMGGNRRDNGLENSMLGAINDSARAQVIVLSSGDGSSHVSLADKAASASRAATENAKKDALRMQLGLSLSYSRRAAAGADASGSTGNDPANLDRLVGDLLFAPAQDDTTLALQAIPGGLPDSETKGGKTKSDKSILTPHETIWSVNAGGSSSAFGAGRRGEDDDDDDEDSNVRSFVNRSGASLGAPSPRNSMSHIAASSTVAPELRHRSSLLSVRENPEGERNTQHPHESLFSVLADGESQGNLSSADIVQAQLQRDAREAQIRRQEQLQDLQSALEASKVGTTVLAISGANSLNIDKMPKKPVVKPGKGSAALAHVGASGQARLQAAMATATKVGDNSNIVGNKRGGRGAGAEAGVAQQHQVKSGDALNVPLSSPRSRSPVSTTPRGSIVRSVHGLGSFYSALSSKSFNVSDNAVALPLLDANDVAARHLHAGSALANSLGLKPSAAAAGRDQAPSRAESESQPSLDSTTPSDASSSTSTSSTSSSSLSTSTSSDSSNKSTYASRRGGGRPSLIAKEQQQPTWSLDSLAMRNDGV